MTPAPDAPPLPAALVTGGAGFIGHHLVDALLRKGHAVRVIDDLSTGRRERLAPFLDRIEFVEGSVADPGDARAAVEGVGIIFHEAAIPSVQRSVTDPAGSHLANATGTLVLLEAAREAGVRRFVYAGSSSAYGDAPELPKRETANSRPMSPYAVSKLTGEHYAQTYHQLHGMETVVLRYFNVFGPGQDPSSQYSAVIPLFITLGFRNQAPTIHGDGGQTRDFTYVANVVEANLLAATTPPERVAGRVFNVGCGDRISVNTLWNEIRELTGASVDPVHGAARPGDVRDSLADLSAIRDAMGYAVGVDLREGLKRTVEWYRPT